MELSLDIEGSFCVDSVLTAIPIRFLTSFVLVVDIDGALTTSVAVVVVSICAWCITLVADGFERVSIGFLDVKLRAEVSTNLICIAVLEGVVPITHRRHEDGVEGGDAATADHAQVYVVGHDASEEVWLVVGCSVEVCRLRQVHSVVVSIGERVIISVDT